MPNERTVDELFDQIVEIAKPHRVDIEYSHRAVCPGSPSKKYKMDIDFCEIFFEKNILEAKIEKLLKLFYYEDIHLNRLPFISQSKIHGKLSADREIALNKESSLRFRLTPEEAEKLRNYLNKKMDYAFSSTNAVYHPR
jgi:hypothetical protein